MRKLVTPLQYNIPIDELNGVRPLETDDIVRTSISIPVLNSLASVDGKIAVGKFMRCTQHGHLLIKNTKQPTQYEYFHYDEQGGTHEHEIVFSQKVYKVIVNTIDNGMSQYFRWCVPVIHTLIQDLFLEQLHHLNFIGRKMSLYEQGIPIARLKYDLYGFY